MKKSTWIQLFFASSIVALLCALLAWKFFRQVPQTTAKLELEEIKTELEKIPSNTYEMVDLDMPVEVFLQRGAGSSQLSMVRRLLLHQWISSNQKDLIKLIVYGKGATSFNELKNLLQMAIEKQGVCNSACSVIQGAIKIIQADPELIEHVDRSLHEGMTQEIHMLAGQMMNTVPESKEYKKIKSQYKKELEVWMDKNHGAFIDKVITKV
ncbi:MAG TPA: hypothetical protein VLG50_03830 [Candidatus Saccharimonadales bacterium]|nr:hypothetical protein [Candidatus Saccharimonadales bacterium]